jgi:hypothetical protein
VRRTAPKSKKRRRPAPKRAPRGESAKPAPRAKSAAQTDPAVDAFLAELEHPLKAELETLRRIILGVSPAIRDGIKWNAPSFRTTEWFATTNLRARDGTERVWLILHFGAKAKATAKNGIEIADPTGLLEWLAKDRCVVTFADKKDLRAKRAALEAILREWILHVR